MKIKIYYLIPVMLLLMASTCKKVAEMTDQEKKEIMQEYPGEWVYNEAKTHVLIKNRTKNRYSATGSLSYKIMDLATKSIVKEGGLREGDIKWLDNNSLELSEVPGMIRADEAKNGSNKKVITLD